MYGSISVIHIIVINRFNILSEEGSIPLNKISRWETFWFNKAQIVFSWDIILSSCHQELCTRQKCATIEYASIRRRTSNLKVFIKVNVKKITSIMRSIVTHSVEKKVLYFWFRASTINLQLFRLSNIVSGKFQKRYIHLCNIPRFYLS